MYISVSRKQIDEDITKVNNLQTYLKSFFRRTWPASWGKTYFELNPEKFGQVGSQKQSRNILRTEPAAERDLERRNKGFEVFEPT